MPTITIPEETYQRLSRRAAALGTTVEAVAIPALEKVAVEPAPEVAPAISTAEERKRHFDEWQAMVLARADRYPPDHVLDVSRESIYEGCGE